MTDPTLCPKCGYKLLRDCGIVFCPCCLDYVDPAYRHDFRVAMGDLRTALGKIAQPFVDLVRGKP